MSHGYDTFVGIDVSKDALDVHGLSAGSPSRFDNTAAGRAKLLTLLPTGRSVPLRRGGDGAGTSGIS